MTARKMKTLGYRFFIVAGIGTVLAGYQNCSKIKVADPSLNTALKTTGQPVAPQPSNDAGNAIVISDQNGDLVPVIVEHPAAPATPAAIDPALPPATDPTRDPVKVVETNQPPKPVEFETPPVPGSQNPPTKDPAAPPPGPIFCGHEKLEFDHAIDLDQLEAAGAKIESIKLKGKVLLYSGRGHRHHLKGLHTGDHSAKIMLAGVELEKLNGFNGEVVLCDSKVEDKKEFKGNCHDHHEQAQESDDDCHKHDNRDHRGGDNSNRDHNKCKQPQATPAGQAQSQSGEQMSQRH